MMPLRIGKSVWLSAALSLVSALALAQESKITASISPNPVSESESTKLQIEVQASISDLVPTPTFDAPDFTLMGAAGLKFTPMPGPTGPNTWKKLEFSFILNPKRSGDFRIRNIKATIGKSGIREAQDIRVTVTPRVLPNRREETTNPAAPGYRPPPVGHSAHHPDATPPIASSESLNVPTRFNSDFTVHVVLNKQRAYVGEPIVAEYYLYDFGNVRQVDVLKWPTFDGFWKEDLHLITQPQFEDIYLQNQEMRRAFIARYALYGIKPGKLPVDRLRIKGKYISDEALAQGLVFGFDMRTGDHSSQETSVEILPLPEAGRPAAYGGAVGQFSLKLEANRTSLPQNSPLNFTLTLSGTGNFQAIDSIKVPLPPDFEVYDTVASGRVTAPIGTRQELESKKTFQVTAIPRKAGVFQIPAISWSYFDPERNSYETLTTNSLTIEVSESSLGQGQNTNSYLDQGPQTSNFKSPSEWRPWKNVPEAKAASGWMKWTILAFIALNLALILLRLRGKWRGIFQIVRKVDRFSEARIALLQAKGIRDSEWQAGLEEVLLMTIQVLLETNPRGLTRQDLEGNWRSRNLPAPLFQRMIAVLDEIDRHRFSSQKLAGSANKEMRLRITREAESLLIEASRLKKK